VGSCRLSVKQGIAVDLQAWSCREAHEFDKAYRRFASYHSLVPIPLGCFDGILLAKILCHRGLFDEYRPSESAS
jgi:hypothetical protein